MNDFDSIHFKELINTRDIGGYRTLDGKTIISGRLIRSGSIDKLCEYDKKILEDVYNVKTVIDLRMPNEGEENSDVTLKDAKYIKNVIFTQEQAGITRKESSLNSDAMMKFIQSVRENPIEYMKKIYREMADNEEILRNYGKAVKIIADNDEGAVLWHCTAGKDRTGSLTAILMLLMNVGRDDIIKDYMRTNEYYSKLTDKLKASVDENDTNKLMAIDVLNNVREEFLGSVLEVIDTKYKDIDDFASRGLGLDNKTVERLREKYLI